MDKDAVSVSSSPTAASSHFAGSPPESPFHNARRLQVRRRTRFIDSPDNSLWLQPTELLIPTAPLSPQAHPSTPLPVRSDSSILSSLHALHADELVYLMRNRDSLLGGHKPYRQHILVTVKSYLYFLWFTWSRAVWNILMLPTSEFGY